MRSHLLNDTTAEQYRRSVTEGIERVAAKLAATDRPFTGVTVDALAPTIDAIDLDKPLLDTAAVLDELEDVYLRDAIYFHHPAISPTSTARSSSRPWSAKRSSPRSTPPSTPGTSRPAAPSSSASSSTGRPPE